MKKLFMAFVVTIFAVIGCSSEQVPVTQDGTTLVVVRHKTTSGSTKRHHKNKSASAMEAAQSGS